MASDDQLFEQIPEPTDDGKDEGQHNLLDTPRHQHASSGQFYLSHGENPEAKKHRIDPDFAEDERRRREREEIRRREREREGRERDQRPRGSGEYRLHPHQPLQPDQLRAREQRDRERHLRSEMHHPDHRHHPDEFSQKIHQEEIQMREQHEARRKIEPGRGSETPNNQMGAMEAMQKRRVEEDHAKERKREKQLGVTRIVLPLQTVREYTYLQEMERLTRVLSYIREESGALFADLYFTQGIATDRRKLNMGIEIIGTKQACLIFTEQFEKIKIEIKNLIHRQLPVDRMCAQPEYQNFLVISHQAYDYLLENKDEVARADIQMELRPPGVTSPPLVRLSGPAYRCRELWEYHLKFLPNNPAYENMPPPQRAPEKAEYDFKTMERKRDTRVQAVR